jgi:hypothetical protein
MPHPATISEEIGIDKIMITDTCLIPRIRLNKIYRRELSALLEIFAVYNEFETAIQRK